MAFEHPTVPNAYDRSPERPNDARLVFPADRILQAAELNEVQSLIERRNRRVGNLVASDGDRVSGADCIISIEPDADVMTVTLGSGEIYVRGDVRPVAAAVLEDVTVAGDVLVGVRLTATNVDHDDDPTLLGLHPGAEAEGEPGAVRVVETIAWAVFDAEDPGDFFAVYMIRDGVVVDQTPPPSLSGINQALAAYDRDANGNYIVEGCRVTALGKDGDNQAFSIEEGVANIYGFKRTRNAALRYLEAETWDVETIAAEPHEFDDPEATGTTVITTRRGPINSVTQVIVTKEATEPVTRGMPSGTSDVLSHSGVTEIISVTQGVTTYAAGTDYVRSGDHIDWSPGGDEPDGGSSYTVTYRYLAAVTPDEVGSDTITISGGVHGTQVLINYGWKLPRVDLICLDQAGNAVYLKGTSARERPVAPVAPETLLPLAEVTNDWRDRPVVRNVGVRAYHYTTIDRMYNRLLDVLDLMGLERLRREIDSREPVAKKGVFVDPFTSDRWRDAGADQSAAVFNGSCQLAIDPTFYRPALAAPVTLEWTEDTIIEQPLVTGCMAVNPYQNFTPLPAKLTINPPVDFWTVSRTEWTSAETAVFGSGNASRTTVADVLVDQREEQADFLRTIPVAFEIEGFGGGEVLESLTFDGIDVTPAGPPEADEHGTISGTFNIPQQVPAGEKLVVATGAGGTTGRASFVGRGRIAINTMRRVTTTEFWSEPEWDLNPVGLLQGDAGGPDPLAQTFMLPEPRHVAGVDLIWCAKGDEANACLVELVTVVNGIPTSEVISSVHVPMATVVLNAWHQVRFPAPVFLPADRQFAIVVKTDDGEHSLAIATLGAFDAAAQRYVSSQPYSVGVLLSSSNARTWTPHQDSDLAFRIVACRFNPTARTVDLGTHDLVDASDLMVRATVELPTAAASMRFEIVRADASVIRLTPDQVMEMTSYVTETVQLRAVLTGSATISPTLFPGVTLVAGKIRAEGTYISRAFQHGTAVDFLAFLKTRLPSGSTLKVEIDKADDDWTEVDLAATEPIEGGWTEQEWRLEDWTAYQGRVRLTLTGSPAARPAVADLRTATM